MLLKVFMFLLLAAECKGKGNIFCDFKENLCNWSNLYGCHFQHETKTPLAGKTGYLQISKNTCNVAAISVSMKSEDPRFRFHYFFNGTGRANIDVYGVFAFSGRKIIWHCDANQGPKWNEAEIYIKPSFFNALKQVIIEVNIFGDVTVAIGRIESPQHGRIDHRCPPSPPIIKPTTKKLITTKATTKRPKITTPKQRTTPVNAGKNHTICSFNLNLCKWRDIDHQCHFKHVKDTPLLGETGYLMLSKDTCKRAALLVRLKEYNFQLNYLMNGTGDMSLSLGILYGFAGRDPLWSCSTSQGPKWHKVDINVHLIHFDPRIDVYIEAKVNGDAIIAIGNVANAGYSAKEKKCPSKSRNLITSTSQFPITPRILPEGTTPKFVRPKRQSTILQDINHVKPASNGIINNVKTEKLQQPQSFKLRNGAIIGGSMAAAILVLVLTMFSIFMYKRKVRMWDVQRTARREIETPSEAFENPLYNRS